MSVILPVHLPAFLLLLPLSSHQLLPLPLPAGEELAPVSAIVGGVAANHIVRALSRVNAPIKNMLLFSLHDGAGVVEDLMG